MEESVQGKYSFDVVHKQVLTIKLQKSCNFIVRLTVNASLSPPRWSLKPSLISTGACVDRLLRNRVLIKTLIIYHRACPHVGNFYFVVLAHLVRSIHKRMEPTWCQFPASLHLFKGLEAAYRVQVSAFWVSWVQKSHLHTFALEHRALRNGNACWNVSWWEVQCCDFIKNMTRIIMAVKAAEYIFCLFHSTSKNRNDQPQFDQVCKQR